MQSATSVIITPRCRICYESADDSELGPLIRPCNCSGSVALVHSGCLNRWLVNKADTSCEMCHTAFEVVSCGLKEFNSMSLPHPLGEDMESRFEFFFLFFWLADTVSLFTKMMLHGGQGLQIHMGTKFGSGWLLYVGTLCTVINFFYYGAIFLLVLDQWLWENSVFVLRDRNSPSEREKILARIQKDKSQGFATCRETPLPPPAERGKLLTQK